MNHLILHKNDTEKRKSSKFSERVIGPILEHESNGTSLITVTSCNVSPDLKRGTIFITVLPDEKEHDALDFAKRKRGELRNYIKKKYADKSYSFYRYRNRPWRKNRQKLTNCLEKSRIELRPGSQVA